MAEFSRTCIAPDDGAAQPGASVGHNDHVGVLGEGPVAHRADRLDGGVLSVGGEALVPYARFKNFRASAGVAVATGQWDSRTRSFVTSRRGFARSAAATTRLSS